MQTFALILAAGEGTRMKSKYPKVIHKVLGRSLVNWAVSTCFEAGISHVCVVVGNGAAQVEDDVRAYIEPRLSQEQHISFVEQTQRLGTGHAVQIAADYIAQSQAQTVVVLSGDSPLLQPHTLRSLIEARHAPQTHLALLTMNLENPFGYGRVLTRDDGHVDRIVEQKDANEAEAACTRCNAGMYAFDAQQLLNHLPRLTNENAQQEYYLTDMVALFNESGLGVSAVTCEDYRETLGVNSRVQLAEAAKILQERINRHWMMQGVTMIDPSMVWIGPDVELARDVELLPMTRLQGDTRIAEDSVVGPNTTLTNTVVESGARINESIAIQAVIGPEVSVGPRAYLRPGTVLDHGSKAGCHVEIKNAHIEAGAKVPHLSYIGDAHIGEGANIGAGTITCNYDGAHKHKTVVGKRAFIGSDTMLVAPVTVGEGAVTGASSCITADVPAYALGLERSEQRIRKGYNQPR